MIDIIDELRVDKQISIALAGAGGKTSLMEYFESSLNGRLLFTTSTKLADDQAGVYDRHVQLYSWLPNAADLAEDWHSLLVTDHMNHEEARLIGLNPEQLLSLKELCEPENIPLIIEADGARRKLLKAPQAWEPVIPTFCDVLIYTCALTALDQQIDESLVFRSTIFAALSGSEIGDRITFEILSDYLQHSQGGLKNIPENSLKILFLNQADLVADNYSKSMKIAEKISGIYDHCFTGSLLPGQEKMERLF